MIAAHTPVMLEAVLRLLDPAPGARIVDATLGCGGHAEAILHSIEPDGVLLGLDRDPEMLAVAAERLRPFAPVARLHEARLSSLREWVEREGLGEVDGVLIDFGLCSAQLDDDERGFSFRSGDAPLDMRMNRSEGRTAAELIDSLDEDELAELLRAGDVPSARRVARALQTSAPLRTTGELTRAVESLRLPRRRHHPATLVFQALRLAVNSEAEEVEQGLEAALDVLAPGGRLVVLSYHSGEDRTVKRFLAREERGCVCPPRLPRCACGRKPRLKVIARGEAPSEEEIRLNPRARSARLRGGERW